MTYYAIQFDSDGNGIGLHTYVEEPATYPANELPCTEVQAQTPTLWQNVNGVLTQSLTATKAAQRALIKSSFIAASTANVTDSNGIVWEGGMQSGNSIFLACQLAQQAGQTTITLYDASKAPHSMTIAEGMWVAALIGTAYQEALAKKNTLYANIDAATSVSEVRSITW